MDTRVRVTISEQAKLTSDQLKILKAIDMLHHACKYLAAQFSVDMSVRDAKANLQARNMLAIKQNRIINGCKD